MKGFLHHFFLPRSSNNHRAKALHTDTLLCYVLIFAIFNFTLRIAHVEFPAVLGYATDIRVDALLTATNVQRSALGLTSLTLNTTLSQAAALKAQDMFTSNYWAHTSPAGKSPWFFFNQAGYKYTIAGENLAKNFSTSSGVVEAWMASPTHKDNIVKSGYRDVGFAVVNGILNGEETTLVVQMFGATNSPIASIPVETSAVAPKPVELPAFIEEKSLGDQTSKVTEVPIVTESETIQTVSAPKSAFFAVFEQPKLNISTITRYVTFIFLGLLIVILALDGLIVSKKRIARVAGHNVAHILFFSAILVAISVVSRGTLL